LEGKRQEYLVGERTLTDMLQAESQLVQAQTSMVQALAQHYTLSYQMLSLFGNLLPESIGLSISRYNVQEYADDARYKLIGAWGTNDSLEPQEQPTTVDKAQ
jgi:outer membrane protein